MKKCTSFYFAYLVEVFLKLNFKHVEMAALLLRHGPDVVNLADKWGFTALHE
jgi:hypothetical protein